MFSSGCHLSTNITQVYCFVFLLATLKKRDFSNVESIEYATSCSKSVISLTYLFYHIIIPCR